jgi:uncharacterized damage-inducible protein DinB
MAQKQLILAQLEASHIKNGWFVAATNALAGLSAEQAAARAGASDHSIWQIVNHVAFWNERYLMRFREQPLPKEVANEATFTGEGSMGSETVWRSVLEHFDRVMNEWKKAIEPASEEKLEGPLQKDSTESWYTVIAHMNIHTAYHVGQIVSLRKQQGSWDPKRGVS